MLDLHTHTLTMSSEAIINAASPDYALTSGGIYSVGVHPWELVEGNSDKLFGCVETSAQDERVAAIGECGIDMLRGGILFRQMLMFRKHVELSERLRKPLIIHCVRAHDIIASLRREMMPDMEWVIHGFRGKPGVAEILLKSGCSLSFGEYFNAESLKLTPAKNLFAETDESTLSIEEIIRRLSDSYGKDLQPNIKANMQRLLGKGN